MDLFLWNLRKGLHLTSGSMRCLPEIKIHEWQGDQLTEEGLGAREEHENLNGPFSSTPALLEILERV